MLGGGEMSGCELVLGNLSAGELSEDKLPLSHLCTRQSVVYVKSPKILIITLVIKTATLQHFQGFQKR
jgi:hypothetical protein